VKSLHHYNLENNIFQVKKRKTMTEVSAPVCLLLGTKREEAPPCPSLPLGHFTLYILVFAFEERKPNFDLWLSRVGFPVHGYIRENPHSCKDTKMATPLDFCRGMSRPVNWYRLMLRHVANM